MPLVAPHGRVNIVSQVGSLTDLPVMRTMMLSDPMMAEDVCLRCDILLKKDPFYRAYGVLLR